MLVGRLPLGKDDSLHPHPIHAPYQEGHAFLGGIAWHRTEMAMVVPDAHGPACFRSAKRLRLGLSDCQRQLCANTLEERATVNHLRAPTNYITDRRK